jgi:putative aldouronate transport system substrate-binding protein
MRNALRLLNVLSIFLVAAVVAMAGAATEKGSADELATITFLSPGEASVRMEEFLENEFAEKIMADLNVEFDVSWSPWGQYWDKLTLTLAAQEPLDFYWDGFGSLAKHASRREATPLGELLKQHGQDVLRIIGRDRLTATTINDEIMAIPSQRGPISEKFYSILMRQDIMDSLGVDGIESLAELEEFAQLALARDPTLKVFSGAGHGMIKMLSREFFTDEKPTFFGPSSSFYVDELSDDSRVYSLIENREYIKFMADTNAEYVKKGWIPETLLTEPGNDGGRFFSGSFLTRAGAVTRPLEDLNGVRQAAPEAILVEYLLNPEVSRYIDRPGNELVFITPYSRHPERTMEFINWIYASPENHDFFIYGVEGKDYTVENDSLELINTDTLFYEWMWRVTDYMRFPKDLDPRAIDQMLHWDDDAQLAKLFGFTFDATDYTAEEAQIDSMWTTDVAPMINGFVKFTDERYTELLEKLRGAGVERYRAALEQQLAEFRD